MQDEGASEEKIKEALGIDEDNSDDDGPKKRGGYYKYKCPECGITVRATKLVNIKCSDCDEDFELEQ